MTSAFVFVRQDAHHTPLQKPYVGPYKVLQAGTKTFMLDMGGKEEIISIDRFKPAHLDIDSPVQVAVPPPRGRPPLQHQPAKAHANAFTRNPGTVSPTAGAPEPIPLSTRSWAQVAAPTIRTQSSRNVVPHECFKVV